VQVSVEYTICLSALVEKEVEEEAEYDDIVESITRDDLTRAEVQPADWDAIKSAWRCTDRPNVYKSDENGIIDWSEPVEDN
jgi:hypothetical protein